jgi:hypothetical protein
MTTVHLVHGFNIRNGGSKTTDKLRPYLEKEGYRVDDQDYGYFSLLKVRYLNDNVARDIAEDVKEGDIGIGHSNGCEILTETADYGAPFRGLVFINPALDVDRTIRNHHLRWVHVYYNPDDSAVWWAERLWFHPWGQMGRVGYWGKDKRYKNYNCSQYGVVGHSTFFSDEHIDPMAHLLIDNIRKEDAHT